MFPSNAYTIRIARARDDRELERLAELDSSPPLQHPILLGEIDGRPAAALSLHENRAVADPFARTAPLLAHLRLRAAALEAHARTPDLAHRIRASIKPAPA